MYILDLARTKPQPTASCTARDEVVVGTLEIIVVIECKKPTGLAILLML